MTFLTPFSGRTTYPVFFNPPAHQNGFDETDSASTSGQWGSIFLFLVVDRCYHHTQRKSGAFKCTEIRPTGNCTFRVSLFTLRPTDLPAHRLDPDTSSWPKGSFPKTKWGQTSLWWPHELGGYHLSKEELDPYRFIGDTHIDEIFDLLDSEDNPLGPGGDFLKFAEEAVRVEKLLRSPAEQSLAEFMEKYSSPPSWVDVDQLRRGQEVFLAYLPSASMALYYRSLIPGFSIPKIAAVIEATAYLAPPARPDQALQRLLDTGAFTSACIGLGVASILPGGEGWKTALYVRVLHAKVRRSLLKRKGIRQWNKKEYGVPINQEDMSATLLAFAVNVLDGIDIIAGRELCRQEKLDYLALWRYLGWLLGVESQGDNRAKGHPSVVELPPLDPCGPGRNKGGDPVRCSAALLESFIDHLMQPNESSVTISHHLLKITDRKPPSLRLSEIPNEFYKNDFFYYRALQCRRLIGNELADALRLPLHPSRWKRSWQRVRSFLFMSLFRCYTLATMMLPFVRKKVISWHANGNKRFHEEWLKTHRSKMAKALSAKDLASCIREESPEVNDAATYEMKLNATADSLCPFAMLTK